MPNFAFHFEVLNQVTAQLVSNGDARGDIMAKHKKFAALGALGPDLLRYLPVSKALADNLDQLASQPVVQGQLKLSQLNPTDLVELFFKPLGGIYSVVFGRLVIPTWPIINKIKSFLDDVDAIAGAENLFAFKAIVGQANNILSEATSLQGYAAGVNGLTQLVGEITGLAAPWMEKEPTPTTNTVPLPPLSLPADDPTANRLSEFLRWHRTGDFALNLLSQATDPRHRAFAHGYLSHVAASVIGESFVNNITGGPYRTHWWRNQLVRNFVDAWTFGYFNSNAQMKGDEPFPPYAAWKPLCSANIQVEFDVGGLATPKSHDVPDAVRAMASGDLGKLPDQFPDDLAQLLLDAVGATYSAAPPIPLPIPGFSKDTFKQAFVGAFAIHWFMTSGSGPMCNNPLGPPPANCETAPDWITSAVAPTPQQAGFNTGGATCAALLATAAVLLLLTGALVAGVAALIAAINMPIVEWDKVRCNLFWLRKTLVDIENMLRDKLVLAALAYPPPQKLGTIDTNGNTRPATDDTPVTGVPLCRSNNMPGFYPRVRDKTLKFADFNYFSYPVIPGVEVPPTEDLIQSSLYPDFAVNGTGLGLNNSILMDGPVPSGATLLVSQKVSDMHVFGDAVSNAVDLIQQDGAGLQNYNLDADRGYGWRTWRYGPNWAGFNFHTVEEV